MKLLFLLLSMLSTPALASLTGEPIRLSREGYDMSACQFLPASRYNVGIEAETLDVTFVNDTGRPLRPAYTDLEGRVKFLSKRKTDQLWKDSTYIGTVWVWFTQDRTCLGYSLAKFEWSDEYQLVSKLIK